MNSKAVNEYFMFLNASHSKCQVCHHRVADAAKEKHYLSCILKLPLFRSVDTQTVECSKGSRDSKTFSLQLSANTDGTEIVDLKEMAQMVILILNQMSKLRIELLQVKRQIELNYENKIKEKAMELYNRINDKVRDLEQLHKNKIATLRQAFRQQLADALACLERIVRKKLEREARSLQMIQNQRMNSLPEQIKDLNHKLLQLKDVNANLLIQLRMAQQGKEKEKPGLRDANETDLHRLDSETESQLVGLRDQLQEERLLHDQLKQENEDLRKIIAHYMGIDDLSLSDANFRQSLLMRKLQAFEKMRRGSRSEERRGSRSEKSRGSRSLERRGSRSLDRRGNLDHQQTVKTERKRTFQPDGSTRMQSTPRVINSVRANRSAAELLRDERPTRSFSTKNEVEYKKELERINQFWELKFSILMANVHAYRDEIFLRQTLHKQALLMHQASVSYSAGIVPDRAFGTFGCRKKPLPGINTLPTRTPGAVRHPDGGSHPSTSTHQVVPAQA